MNKEFTIDCIENAECLVCLNTDVRVLLDLGKQPLANSYHTNSETLQCYPLKLNICPSCFHLQQSHTVNPDLMFKHYLYVSGTTNTLHEYFKEFAEKTKSYYPDAKTVLDIACNDGTQLDYFQKLGLTTYGIDPATNLHKVSTAKGHSVICDYFSDESVAKVEKTFDIITAQNVFAHTKYVFDFLNNCKKIMHDKSVLFIQTSQANMVVNNEFDTVYHEHISFFNSLSMKTLVERAGLQLNDIFKTDIHGTSYVFVITKNAHLKINNVQSFIDSETEQGLYKMSTYGSYVNKCYQATFELKENLIKLRNDGYMLIGYGAAAKGNTLLNFGKIDLDVIIDDNPLKQDLLTPGQNIPIRSVNILDEIPMDRKIAFVPLAWNFYKEICTRIQNKRKNNNDIFIKYFPSYEESNSY